MTDTAGKQGTGGEKSDNVPELDELARRLLDLWQDQLSAVAANPDLAAQAARLMAAMPLPGMWLSQLGQMGQAGGSGDDLTKAWARMTQDWMAQDWWKGTAHGSADGAKSPNTPPGSSPGATPAAAASQPRGSDLDELGRRLAGIEQRLAELADGKPKRSPAAKPRAAAAKPRRPRTANPKGGSGSPDGGAAG